MTEPSPSSTAPAPAAGAASADGPPPSSAPPSSAPGAVVAAPAEEPWHFVAERPWIAPALMVLGVSTGLIHLYFNIIAPPSPITQNGVHFALFALLGVLVYPLVKRRREGTARPPWMLRVDLGIGLLAAMSALYFVANEVSFNRRYESSVEALSLWDWLFGVALLLCALDLVRRVAGWVVPILMILATLFLLRLDEGAASQSLLSTAISWLAGPDHVFTFAGLSAETVLFRSIYGDDALFGNIAGISSRVVFLFILFGAFLVRSGAGAFIIDLARAVAGRIVGGPGLVAVMSSALTGTISGSAIANTASTGVITIPLMKRSGFPAKTAAGIEAAASTGGQLMPPIMGAGAFVMVTLTLIPYETVVTQSILPALLYFAAIGFSVRLAALDHKATALDGDAPSLKAVMARGGASFFIPITVLLTLLVLGFTPMYAAGWAILAVIAGSWLSPTTLRWLAAGRPGPPPAGLMTPKAVIEALALGARNMILTALLLCAVGIVVNAIVTTGVGNTLALRIADWSDGSLMLAIILTALASLVLGMGLPVTAAYIVVATLMAPALRDLIINGEMAALIAAGTLPESAQGMLGAVVMLNLPDFSAVVGEPMSLEDARLILANLGDLKDQVRNSFVESGALSADTILYALLSAHLIIFWLSQDSNVTPPVCLAAFTAAGIAKSPPMATGVAAWRMAKALYVVPILMAYTGLVGADLGQSLQVTLFALVGLFTMAATFQGYWWRRLHGLERLVLLAITLGLFWPLPLWAHVAALAAAVSVGLLLWATTRGKPQGSDGRSAPQ